MPDNIASETLHAHRDRQDTRTRRLIVWAPALSAALYPWILDAFHRTVSAGGDNQALSAGASRLAALWLLVAFLVPLGNLLLAGQSPHPALSSTIQRRARRFAMLAMAAPTIYVFFGVLTYMAGSTLPDKWLWTPIWLLLGAWLNNSRNADEPVRAPASAKLRVAHGIAGSLATLYVLFHLFNHLFGLVSPESHATVMEIGRHVYRAPVIEPLLVLVMLFQIGSGLHLAWTWSYQGVDRYRMFQVASGLFLAVFILGHMNSVFIFARTFLGIPTDWAFATGAPTGLIHDPWNIRLVPHYALGVFFVLTHLASGLRGVMLAHGARPSFANRAWWCGAAVSALLAAAILCGMCGVRLFA
ncbi:hypothetical protein PHLH7_38070 [Pseudomonas sp. Ost2]|uniref:hypothetical protein n=1 Tax=Pseudomonas TaxID=286 RepID=UPI001BB312A7|nr:MULTISPECIES: hypothetical protein [Pseudomonas]BBP77703.1 hypothetical protein PHLH7_38070 [Pseudomonas sp. Ost2]